jgi:peptidoglycan/LPS O-acetylase OafA/YrhL
LHLPVLRWYEYSFGDWLALGTLTRGLFRTGPAHLPYAAVNSVYWTLAIEVQFYLVMTLAVALRARFREFLAGVTVLSACWYYLGPVAPGFFPIYWPMFAFGIALYGLINRGWRPSRIFGPRAVPASTIVAMLALAGALCLAVVRPSLSLQRQTYFAAACAAFLWAASGFEHALPVKHIAARAFSGLGKMSYTVYLMHLPLVALINPNVARLRLHNTILSAWISVVLTIPMMVVFYYLFERRWAKAPRPSRRAEPAITPRVPEAEAVLVAD